MLGASSGETPRMSTRSEKSRALSETGKKSRTMVIAATCATQPPNAWRKRRAMSTWKDGANRQAMVIAP